MEFDQNTVFRSILFVVYRFSQIVMKVKNNLYYCYCINTLCWFDKISNNFKQGLATEGVGDKFTLLLIDKVFSKRYCFLSFLADNNRLEIEWDASSSIIALYTFRTECFLELTAAKGTWTVITAIRPSRSGASRWVLPGVTTTVCIGTCSGTLNTGFNLQSNKFMFIHLIQ